MRISVVFTFGGTMNYAAMNIYVHIFVWMYVFLSLKCLPGNEITWPIFNILRNYQTIFQSDCIILHLQKHCMSLLHSCQHLLISFIYYSHSGESGLVYHCGFNLHSLMTMMLGIFSCAYWMFVYLLQRNVYSDALPNFNWIIHHFIIEF